MYHLQNIITSTPYRISLGGGGTDLPFYYKEKGGFLISAAINHYLNIHLVSRNLDDKIFLQYTQTEWEDKLEKIKHRLIKSILGYFNMDKSIQVSVISSMPSYTGLGASSSLTVGLVNAIIRMNNKRLSKEALAKTAHYVERSVACLDGGFQDQYIAALGGIQKMSIDQSGAVKCENINIEKEKLLKLKQGLVLVHSKIERRSSQLIKAQYDSNTVMDCYDKIKKIGYASEELLINADIEGLGAAMDDHWKVKRKITPAISNSVLDDMYIKLKEYGATGGKIIGAGGGGFFLMTVPKDRQKFMALIKKDNMRALGFDFEFKGSHVLRSQKQIEP